MPSSDPKERFNGCASPARKKECTESKDVTAGAGTRAAAGTKRAGGCWRTLSACRKAITDACAHQHATRSDTLSTRKVTASRREQHTVGIRVALLLRGDRGHLESTTGTYGASETRSDTQRSVRTAQESNCPRPPSSIILMCIHGHVQQCDWSAWAGERRILNKACAEAFYDGHAPRSRSVPPPSSASASGKIANCIARTERDGVNVVVNVHTLPVRPNPRARVRSHPSLPI